MRRDLKHFNPGRAPTETLEKSESLEYAESLVTQKLIYGRDNLTWPLQHDLVNLPELALMMNTGNKYQASLNYMGQELKKIGARRVEKYTTVANKTVRKIVW